MPCVVAASSQVGGRISLPASDRGSPYSLLYRDIQRARKDSSFTSWRCRPGRPVGGPVMRCRTVCHGPRCALVAGTPAQKVGGVRSASARWSRPDPGSGERRVRGADQGEVEDHDLDVADVQELGHVVAVIEAGTDVPGLNGLFFGADGL